MTRHLCYDQTRIVCAVCGAQAHLCGVVGMGIERMQRVVEAARALTSGEVAAIMGRLRAIDAALAALDGKEPFNDS